MTKTGASRQYLYYNTFDARGRGTDELRGRNFVFDLYQDQENMLWIACFNCFKRLNPETDEVESYPHTPDNPTSLSWRDAVVVTKANGLNRFDWGTKIFKRFSHEANDYNSLSNNRIKLIYETINGDLWVGTDGGA